MSTETIVNPNISGSTASKRESWIVVVYDNDHNSFEEVMMILMVATKCNFEEAQLETWEVHNLGKSVVHHGSQDECERVAIVIRQIGIKVEVLSE